MMRFMPLAMGLLLSAGACQAVAYDLGSMTCEEIARFSQASFRAKEKGQTLAQAMAQLEQLSFQQPIEKENFAKVIKLIYGFFGEGVDDEGSYGAMLTECESHRR